MLTLRARKSVLGPAKGVTICVQESVLLLNTKPWLLIFGLCHHLVTCLPAVCFYEQISKNKNYKKIVNLPQVLFLISGDINEFVDEIKISFTCWFFVVFVNFTKHQFIGVSSERVPEYGHRVEVHIRVRALCLVCTGSIIVPNGTIYKYPKQEVIQHADISIHQTTFYISIIIQAFLIPM